ncbi:MAG: POTRA domain-containing protein, partial [Thermodesulfobacteriota bacterium]|nr:POTRA domain-containing protein [Thermodesulfobacteriota bacterium]
MGESLFIKKVQFTGVQRSFSQDIKKKIITKNPSWKPWVSSPVFDEDTLKKDVKRIENFYRNYGYYHTHVDYKVEKFLNKNTVKIEFIIDEKRPTLVEDIQITILDSAIESLSDNLMAIVSLTHGDHFRIDRYEKSKEDVRRFLANHGYAYARVSGKSVVDKRSFQAQVTFTIDPGLLYHFGQVSIMGNRDVKTDLILRELSFHEEDIFSLEKVYESQQNIFKLGLFKSVIIKPRDTNRKGTQLPIEIIIEEGKKREIQVGVGYGDEDKFRAQTSWGRKNFLGNLRSLGITLKYSSLIQSGTVHFIQPYVIDRSSNLDITLGFDRENLESYTNERISSQVKIVRNLSRDIAGFVAYDLELSRPVSVDETVMQELIETKTGEYYFISAISLGLSRDTVKDNLDPQKGSVCSLLLEPASFLFGSEVDYLKGVVEAKVYRGIVADLVLATKCKIGFVEPLRKT